MERFKTTKQIKFSATFPSDQEISEFLKQSKL